MTWRTVMEDDLLDLRRSKLGIGVAIVTFAFTGGIGFLVFLTSFTWTGSDPMPFDTIMVTIGVLLSFILPFIAMLASVSAIVHERETGSVRFLLGLPNSRLDAYAGKYLSRTILYVGSTLVGFLALGAVAFTLLGNPVASAYLLFFLATLLFGLTFVGFGLAASAVLDSELSATVGIISLYAVFRGGWMIMQYGGLYLTRGQNQVTSRPLPEWYFFLGRLNPINAYVKIFVEVFERPSQALVRQTLLTTPSPSVNTVATSTGYAVVALALWLVVVPVVGYLVFVRKDVL